jgi:MYXO-CTERM domain-containing protein
VKATATTITADVTLAGTADVARVTFTFPTPEVLEVELALDTPATLAVNEELEDRGDHYYGVWEYPFGGHLDNRGNDRPYLGLGNRDNPGSLFTNGRAPFYVSSRRHGLYARSSVRGRFALAVAGKTSFGFDGKRLKYDVIYGPGYYDVLARYTALAGGPFLPPLWALGTMWWADDFHRDLRATTTAQENVLDLATQLQAQRLPAASLLIDRPFGTGFNGWGNMDWDESFPDPGQMVRDLRGRGLELVVWIANRAWNGLYDEGVANGYLFPGSSTLGPAADLRNPAAYAWMKGKLAPFVALGAKGYKIDRGEQGEHPDEVQNQNVTLFARLAQESLASQHAAEGFVFARNVVDTGRQHAAVWNGDSRADFSGLAYSVTAGLRSGAIVMPMWGSDTGGYLRSATAPTEEVFARWLGFSAYCPMMEVLVGDGHTPWYHHSPALVAIARKHAAAHHDLIPYVRSFLHAATRTGAPVMRALVFEYPDDATVADRSDEYLFGSELLVAPVLVGGATVREVYLPAGRWLEYEGRRAWSRGPASVAAPAPLDTIPVFVREGGIVPRGRLLRGNDSWTPDWSASLRVELFPGEGAISRRFDYFTGSATAAITLDTTAARRATITVGALGLPAKLEIAARSVGRVLRDGAALAAGQDYTFDAQARLLTLSLSGPATVELEDLVSVFTAEPGDVPLPPARDAATARDGGDEPEPPPVSRPAGGGGCACATARGRLSGASGAWALVSLLAAGIRRRKKTGSS